MKGERGQRKGKGLDDRKKRGWTILGKITVRLTQRRPWSYSITSQTKESLLYWGLLFLILSFVGWAQ